MFSDLPIPCVGEKKMTHVVTARCVDCRYTDCCAVCPVDCFYETTDPAMLVIDPETCIDCELCVPECPINAIYPEEELPEEYSEWLEKNAELFGEGTQISEKTEALPGALTLEEIQEKEKGNGWEIEEPSKAF
jgi:ferredoxin